MLCSDVNSRLQRQHQQGRWRQRRALYLGPKGGCRLVSQPGNAVLNFAGNDYLGLSQHPLVKKAASDAIAEYGVGSTASAQGVGFHAEHQALQQELAAWLGFERVLLFSSGFMANMGLLTALLKRDEVVIHDRDNHASLIDGCRQAQARIQRYRHLDLQDLQRLQLKLNQDNHCLVTERVFSMDGTICPVETLMQQAATHYTTTVIIDDSHGIGVLPTLKLDHGKRSQVVYSAGLGKAFGVMGGVVAGSEAVIEACTQFARSAIYSTALPPALAAAARASLAIITSPEGKQLQQKLDNNIAYFKALCRDQGLVLLPSDTAIQSLVFGQNDQVLNAQQALEQQGVLVSAMRPPSVAENTARLRISLSAAHEPAAILRLVQALSHLHNQESISRG